MSGLDNFYYLKRVDKLTQKLRARCLGYDLHLMELLPESCRTLPEDRKAMQLARQILFQLTEQCPAAEREELERSWQWLYSIALYLFREIREEDQNFGGLLKLAEVDYFARHTISRNMLGIEGAILEDLTQPEPLEQLEETVLTLLDRNGMLEEGKKLCKQIERL